MLFNSLEFVIFILIVIPLHAILRGRLWRIMMVVASYIFYGWANPYYCLLLLFSTVLDFNVGQQLATSDNETIRKRWLLFSLVGNLGILGLFKYSGFFIRSLNDISMLVNVDLGLIAPEIILPIGISFYTFQTLSYTIDIY
jgi:alginate O-acetyltransferase complex protein AlgI